uniref:Peptidase M13 N-terminal domain-containing protein n=1 Tax=Amblyomma maculatum TaxID=34609 RepID=G3MKN7_AMBMU
MAMNFITLLSIFLWLCSVDSWGPPWHYERYHVCSSPVCQQRARLIRSYMNPYVDPCEDFYSYACGGWLRRAKIPEKKSSHGSFNILNEELMKVLRGLLERITVGEGTQNVLGKLALTYNACLKVPITPDRHDALSEIMNISGFADWPISSTSVSDVMQMNHYADVLLKVGMGALLRYDVTRDSKNTTAHVIQLDQMTFPFVGRNQLINPEDKHSKPIIAAYKILVETTMKYMAPSISQSELTAIANTLVSFEGKLANLTATPEERRDVLSIYYRTTISSLQKICKNFPILGVLNKEFIKGDIVLTEDETIEVHALKYYKRLAQLLEKTKPVTLFNFIGLRVMFTWAPHASKSIRDAFFELNKAKTGIQERQPRWEKCTSLMNKAMKEITGYLYVKEKFTPEAKREVEDLVVRLKEVFQESLQQNRWMDKTTKAKALLKLRKMVAKIAYPSWGLNLEFLEGLYNYVPQLDPNSAFLTMWHHIAANNGKKKLEKLRQSYQSELEWITGAALVNAFYNSNSNEMVYPSGILQSVFYQYGLPRSVNFGGIGAIVGHEMTHGFDDQGSQFNHDGRLEHWWSNLTRARFNKKAECFKRQYGRIYVRELNMTLNGENTVGENIADNGGIRLAFKAYHKLLTQECDDVDTRLHGIEYLSGRKLFFIAHAMVWCNLSRKKHLKHIIQYDPHSPSRFRINIPFKNSKAFARVFGCRPHSAMHWHPKNRCTLW